MSRETSALPLRLAVLVSGSGTTLQGLLDAIDAGKLQAEIVAVVSSRREAYALERAHRRNIPTHVLRPRDFLTAKEHDAALAKTLREVSPDLIVLAGYMVEVNDVTLGAFHGRIMNIHPSLLPAFGGRGFYGQRVHKAVLDAGCKVSGVTVHFVEAEVDGGPIILQAAVEVEDADTCETLAARVNELERRLYPRAIQLYAEGRLCQVGRRVRILK
ncbi:MAG: Phosphoribosylglycinamide formyltransferase [Firmicutes bacterium]|nr:Phosphoribosylglycinamide formyltransferase [Bacillota bacterium]